MNSLFKNITQSSQPLLLKVFLLSDGYGYEMHVNDIKLQDLESIKRKIGKQTVSVLISGKGVLIKKIEVAPNIDDQKLLNIAMPGFNSNEVCYQIQKNLNEPSELSFIRKKTLQELLDKFKTEGMQVADCYLGESDKLSDNGIQGSEQLNEVRTAFINNLKIKRKTVSILLFTFLALLINYLVFDSYRNKLNDISGVVLGSAKSIEHYNTLISEVKSNKTFLEQSGFTSSPQTSYYIDRLAHQLPNSVRWTSIQIFPTKKIEHSQEDNSLTFSSNEITLNGNCQKNTDLNTWLQQIQEFDWIKNVSLLNYIQQTASEPGTFLIKITLK